MKKYLNAALHKLTVLLEFIISFVLAAGIIILLVQLSCPCQMFRIWIFIQITKTW